MVWDIFIVDGHPALARDRLSLQKADEAAGVVRTLALSNAGYHRIACDEKRTCLSDVLAAVRSFGPPEVLAKVQRAPEPQVVTVLTVDERPIKESVEQAPAPVEASAEPAGA
jgi:hypothetical protein